jgi:aspartokinase
MLITNNNLLSSVFNLAKQEDITIYMISLSEISLNILVESSQSQNFMNKIHEKLITKET